MIYYILYTIFIYYILYIIHHILYIIYYTSYIIYHTSYIHYTLHIVSYTMYYILCTMYHIRCAIYHVFCAYASVDAASLGARIVLCIHYGMATLCMLPKFSVLFCKRALHKKGSFTKGPIVLGSQQIVATQ